MALPIYNEVERLREYALCSVGEMGQEAHRVLSQDNKMLHTKLKNLESYLTQKEQLNAQLQQNLDNLKKKISTDKEQIQELIQIVEQVKIPATYIEKKAGEFGNLTVRHIARHSAWSNH